MSRFCQLAPKRRRIDEVRERAAAVDLDDGDELAVARLELGVARDVDLRELELELGPNPLDRLLRPLAEVATAGAVQDELRYG